MDYRLLNIINQLSDSEQEELSEYLIKQYCVDDPLTMKYIEKRVFEIIASQAMVQTKEIKPSSELKKDLNLSDEGLDIVIMVINFQLEGVQCTTPLGKNICTVEDLLNLLDYKITDDSSIQKICEQNNISDVQEFTRFYKNFGTDINDIKIVDLYKTKVATNGGV